MGKNNIGFSLFIAFCIGPALSARTVNDCGSAIRLIKGETVIIDRTMSPSEDNPQTCTWALVPDLNTTALKFHYEGDEEDGPTLYGWGENHFEAFPLNHKVKDFAYSVNGVAFLSISSFYLLGYKRFELRVEAIAENDKKERFKKLVAHMIPGKEGTFPHPIPSGSQGNKYGNDEHISFVIPAEATSGGVLKKSLKIENINIEPLWDSLYIFTLLPHWQYTRSNRGVDAIGPITGKMSSVKSSRLSSTYPRVVYFRSDKKVQKSGFTLKWSSVEEKNF